MTDLTTQATPEVIVSLLNQLLQQVNESNLMTRDLWSDDDIAQYLQCSKKTVQNTKSKDATFPGPATREGLRSLYKREEVIQWATRR